MSYIRLLAEFAGLDRRTELVYDLIYGNGIPLPILWQDNARKVVGIEYVPEAIEDAKENAAYKRVG